MQQQSLSNQNIIRTHPKKNWFAVIALLTIPLSGLGVDINVPSLPALTHYFHSSNALAQLTITAYIAGFGFFQLFAGTLSDSFGRKTPCITAMIISILSFLCAPWVTDIYQLLALRFIQGIAVSCISVPMRAIFSDLFEGKDFYKIINYVNMAWALGPILAPAIGGYLQAYFGWQAPFYFLATYTTVMLILNLGFMPETLADKRPLKLKSVLKNYRQMLANTHYLSSILCLGFIYSFLILFGIIGPFLIQTVLHYSPIQFGHMALFMGLAWFLGHMTNRLLINLDPQFKIALCFWLMLIGAAIMSAIACWLPLHINYILIPTACLLYIGAIAFPNYYASSIATFPNTPATANALMGAFMVVIAGVVTGLSTLLKSNTQLPLALTFSTLIGFCLVVYYWNKRKSILQRQKSSPSPTAGCH